MSHYVNEGFKGYSATVAIPAYTAVKVGADPTQIIPAASATDPIIGVIHAAVKAGWQIDVRLRSAAGTANIKVSANVALGAAITSDANGLGITAGTAGQQIIGYALEAGTTGSVIEFLPSTGKF